MLAVAAVVLMADFASKRAVHESLALGERHELIPGLLVLTHVQNTGAAYGLLAGQRWLLVITAAVIAAATPLLLRALPVHGRFAWAGPVLTGMIVGGAVGNIAQRALRGYVTDFLQTPPIPLFQVFNLADASISVAVTALIVLTFLLGDRPARASAGASGAAAEDAGARPSAPAPKG
jgi:signal peptidase II